MNYNKNRGLQSDQLLLRAMISFDIFYTHGFHETGSSFVGCLMSPLCGDVGVSFGFHVSSAHSGTSFVGCLMSPLRKGQDGCTEEQYCLVTYTLFTIEN